MSVIGDLFGGNDSASDAAAVQSASADKAIALQKETRDIVRKDLEPFREVGTTDLSRLGQLVTDPNAQKDFISNNPFFKSLADDSQKRIFNNAAARGKVGSGGTAKALQNSLVLLGEQLLGRDITRRSNLAAGGQNAASGQGAASQNAGNTIADLFTQQGNAQAAGIIGDQNSRNAAGKNLLQAGFTAFKLSDMRMKEEITKIGQMDNGIPIYTFKYIGYDGLNVGVMAQEVEKVIPDAVIEHDGIKYVNYEALSWH